MRHRVSRLVTAFACLLLLGAAACGGGDDDDPSDSDPKPDVQTDGGDMLDAGDVTPTPDAEPDIDQTDKDVERDTDQPDPDIGTDGGQEDVDTGPDPSEIDSDSDGLTNAEERQLCGGAGSDPFDGDTDGDGLADYEEVQKGTSPCKADTDGDGASDRVELNWGLNPNDRVTYSDGELDGNRWILTACEGETPGEVDFHQNSTGNWNLALPPAFTNYTNLTINTGQAPLAAAVYDDPTNEVAGFMLSEDNPTAAMSPQQPLQTQPAGQVFDAVRSVATVDQDLTQGEFNTHDGYKASSAEYEVTVDGGAVSTRKFRDQLLLSIAPFGRGDVSGLPNSSGATYSKFKVTVTVIFRPNLSGPTQRLVTVAIAPLTKAESDPFVKFRIDDLTNTTNIAEEVDSHLNKCARFTADAQRPQAEFYWVLDQSGSMNDDNQKIIDFSNKFEKEVQNTALDYRLGVTNMDPGNDGRLRTPPAWHTKGSVFGSEVDGAVVNCSEWACSGGSEYGLEVARDGIRYMTGAGAQQPTPPEEIRAGANVITIFMSDEEANSAKNNNFPSGISNVGDFISYFNGRTTAFAIVGDGNSCGTDNGQAYKDVALGTGGKTASLCATDLTQTIQDIIFAATGVASNYNPSPRPISSSLKVFMNDTWVPRSEENGYNYFANENSVAFFGTYRPDPDKADKPNVAPDRIAIIYETWQDKCKESGQGAFNCSSAGSN